MGRIRCVLGRVAREVDNLNVERGTVENENVLDLAVGDELDYASSMAKDPAH